MRIQGLFISISKFVLVFTSVWGFGHVFLTQSLEASSLKDEFSSGGMKSPVFRMFNGAALPAQNFKQWQQKLQVTLENVPACSRGNTEIREDVLDVIQNLSSPSYSKRRDAYSWLRFKFFYGNTDGKVRATILSAQGKSDDPGTEVELQQLLEECEKLPSNLPHCRQPEDYVESWWYHPHIHAVGTAVHENRDDYKLVGKHIVSDDERPENPSCSNLSQELTFQVEQAYGQHRLQFDLSAWDEKNLDSMDKMLLDPHSYLDTAVVEFRFSQYCCQQRGQNATRYKIHFFRKMRFKPDAERIFSSYCKKKYGGIVVGLEDPQYRVKKVAKYVTIRSKTLACAHI